MTNEYGFFSSKDHDRAYSAEDFCSFFRDFYTDGVLGGNAGELKVSADSGMSVKVSPGTAYIDGRFYRPAETKHIEIHESDGTYPRKDIIVIRCDYSARKVLVDVVEGIASASPKAPEPVRSGMVYELCIAEISVAADALEITDADITDTRFDTSLCGIVTGAIDTIDTTDLFRQYQQAWDLLMSGAALDEPAVIELFNGLLTVKKVNGISPDEDGNVDIITKNIDNIPVDLTGIYNTQLLGYDEKHNKIVPMDNFTTREETLLPASTFNTDWTNTYTNNSTVQSGYNYPYIKNSSTVWPTSFSATFVTNEPYVLSDLTTVKFTIKGTSSISKSAAVAFSKSSDFSEIDASFSGESVTGDITALKGLYYIRIYLSGSFNDSGNYYAAMDTLTLS